MIRLRSQLGKIRRMVLSSLRANRITLGNREPIVSFCFDDFPVTAYTVGGSILKSFGARGTYYAAMGLLDTRNSLGRQFRTQDLESLLGDGHELASHTFSHLSCRSVPRNVFEKDMQKGQEAIRKATGYDPVSFAYPYGHVTFTAKKRIGAQVRSCRGTWGGLNGPMVDLNLLRANSVYGDIDRFAELESLLEDNHRRNGWLIFYTHDVSRGPSPFGCTPSLLEKVVASAVSRGSRIAPVREVLEHAETVSI